jgi:DNA-binding NarL/FixJ family response regulator
MNKVKIIVADDHKLFINGLQLLMKDESWIEIIEIAHDGKELLDILHKNIPDLILLDINMPVLNGLNAVHYIKQAYPQMKIIMLSTYNEPHLIEKAKNLGVNGYLLKNSDKDELFHTIKLVNSGHLCFPYLSLQLENEFDSKDRFLKQFNITKREFEILELIKNNLTNQQIANKLFLSVYTIETHRKNIMQKLGLRSPIALMKFILENKL